MTAYARATLKTSQGHWLLELHSLNRKGIDVNLQLPPDCLALEIEIRKFFLEQLVRGQLTVRLGFTPDLEELQTAQLEPLRRLQKSWNHVALELGYPPKEAVTFAFLTEQAARSRGVSCDSIVFKTLQPLFIEAFAALVQMKEREGSLLQTVLVEHLKKIGDFAQLIAKRAPEVLAHYTKRLQEKMREFADMPDSEDRILRELSFFAEKSDITEELERLQAHRIQFQERLVSLEKSVGKLLDFLLQEMAREANTICSKSVDAAMTHLAVEMKGEIEKMREQVQNIE